MLYFLVVSIVGLDTHWTAGQINIFDSNFCYALYFAFRVFAWKDSSLSWGFGEATGEAALIYLFEFLLSLLAYILDSS